MYTYYVQLPNQEPFFCVTNSFIKVWDTYPNATTITESPAQRNPVSSETEDIHLGLQVIQLC